MKKNITANVFQENQIRKEASFLNNKNVSSFHRTNKRHQNALNGTLNNRKMSRYLTEALPLKRRLDEIMTELSQPEDDIFNGTTDALWNEKAILSERLKAIKKKIKILRKQQKKSKGGKRLKTKRKRGKTNRKKKKKRRTHKKKSRRR